MTGFGKGSADGNTGTAHVEIKCVNSKGLDLLPLRLPAELRSLEPEIISELGRRLVRGRVEVNATFTMKDTERTTRQINIDAMQREVLRITKAFPVVAAGIPHGHLISSMLTVSALWEDLPVELSEGDTSAVFRALQEAIESLQAFRLREGEATQRTLEYELHEIARLAKDVDALKDERVARVRKRIEEGLAKLKGYDAPESDEARLAQELFYYIEKLDIHEELQRLFQHITYFRETMREATPVGRKLGFIAQEMGREINTLGSKANHSGIQHMVVMMKDHLERIKEQIPNLL